MKTYILLRNNRESGPYTQKQLKAIGVCQSDLIWIEKESTLWQHPAEIQELKTIAKQGIKTPLADESFAHSTSGNGSASFDNNLSTAEDSFPEKPSNNQYSFYSSGKQRRALAANFFGLAVLLIGIMLCAFVMKKMVDGFGYGFSPSSQAKEIKMETLALSTNSYTAQKFNESFPVYLVLNDSTLKDSIQKSKVGKKLPSELNQVVAISKENPDSLIQASLANSQEKAVTETVSKVIEDSPEIISAVASTHSLQVSANEYKVGLFGGISGLELSLSNPSSFPVTKATVEVDYLKPNGTVIKSQTIFIENISPGTSKKLAVPDSNRGVKVRYRVVNVAMKDAKPVENNS